MDIKNLCQKIDMDIMRVKIPQMPAISAIPQIKFPKSMPKLKSRKIFGSSRKEASNKDSPTHQKMTIPIPPSEFIDHTPKRISTISSLIHQKNVNTYQSADSIDEDFAMPTHQYTNISCKPISPQHTIINGFDVPHNSNLTNRTNSLNNVKMSLSEKLQKGYKDFSDFKLKHIFVKKTVVRKDVIQIHDYIEQFNKDLLLDQQEEKKRDQEIAENYRLRYKISRQNTGHTNSLTSNESPQHDPNCKQKADENDMKIATSMQKQGTDSNVLTKEHSPQLRQNSDSCEDDNIKINEKYFMQPTSKIRSNKNNLTLEETNISHTKEHNEIKIQLVSSSKNKFCREKIKRFQSYLSQDEPETETVVEAAPNIITSNTEKNSILYGLRKHGESTFNVVKNKNVTQQEVQNDETNSKNISLGIIKHNFKKLRKSINLEPNLKQTIESKNDENVHENKQRIKTQKFTTHLPKFLNSDSSIPHISNHSPKKTEISNGSPIRTTLTSKLEMFKNSFKQKSTANNEDDTDKSFSEKQKRSNTLIKKIKNMRSGKNSNSMEDLDENKDVNFRMTTKTNKTDLKATPQGRSYHFDDKFEQARQRTLKKVNEKMQQIKFFQKQEQSNNKNEETNKTNNEYEKYTDSHSDLPQIISQRVIPDYFEETYEDENEEFQSLKTTRAVWTKSSILSEMTESDSDEDLPRVVIHQDNSDAFESKLIIAVTRPGLSPSLGRMIEIFPEERKQIKEQKSKTIEWNQNREIPHHFLKTTATSDEKLPTDILVASRHGRKLSMDTNSENYCEKNKESIKEGLRCTSIACINARNDHEMSWKTFLENKLTKEKSKDIFEINAKKGTNGVFEDFDDELKNEPILKIDNQNFESADEDSSEDVDAADDDNSSRVTTILKGIPINEKPITIEKKLSPNTANKASEKNKPQQQRLLCKEIGNSCESLIGNFDENEEFYIESNTEGDFSPLAIHSLPPLTSPPPSISPPPLPSISPPPLPHKNHSMCLLLLKQYESTLPPLTITKQQLPPLPKIPERTSLSRNIKPLVKTSSLRLTFTEQVKSTDKGKVNKLISRFEHTQSNITPQKVFRAKSEELSDEEDDDDDNKNNNTTYLDSNMKSKIDNYLATKSNSHNFETMKNDLPLPTKINSNFAEDKNNLISKNYKMENNCSPHNVPIISIEMDKKTNFSCTSSEYSSPLEYPSSLIGSNETTPQTERREKEMFNSGRNRRSIIRDHENFYSIDSDEENSYYSLSSSSYIVEI